MKKLISTVVVCVGVLGASVVSAAPLSGTFRIDGDENDVRVGADYVDFGPFGTGTGEFEVTTATGDFAGLHGGLIKDLMGMTVGAISVSDFVEFTTRPQWDFTLTHIFAGAGTAAACLPPPNAGDVCTPPGSPFTIINLSASSSAVALRVAGVVNNGMNEFSTFTGTFTSQLDTLSAEGALQQIEDEVPPSYVQSSWSAEFTVTPHQASVPEPASLGLLGLALSGMGVALRRRRE